MQYAPTIDPPPLVNPVRICAGSVRLVWSGMPPEMHDAVTRSLMTWMMAGIFLVTVFVGLGAVILREKKMSGILAALLGMELLLGVGGWMAGFWSVEEADGGDPARMQGPLAAEWREARTDLAAARARENEIAAVRAGFERSMAQYSSQLAEIDARQAELQKTWDEMQQQIRDTNGRREALYLEAMKEFMQQDEWLRQMSPEMAQAERSEK